MAHLDAKHIIDGEIDSRLEHLRSLSDEVGCALFRQPPLLPPPERLQVIPDYCVNAQTSYNKSISLAFKPLLHDLTRCP